MKNFIGVTAGNGAKINQSKPTDINTKEKENKIMNNNINSDTKDNGNNSITHLSFGDYFESDWRKHFQEKDTVQSILEAADLSYSHDFVQINSRYLIDNNRVAVITLVRRKNTEVLDKLIIDIIAGDLSFEQFIDVVYNIGSDCDYRMILHDQNSKN